MIVFLSGPMRGWPEFNFPAFHAHAAKLREAGHEVLSPAEHDLERGFDPKLSLAKQGYDLAPSWRWNIQALLRSDAIALMPGHWSSEGASLERNIARNLGLTEIHLAP